MTTDPKALVAESRCAALVRELYEDAKKRQTAPIPVREPLDRALELADTLEKELAVAAACIEQLQRELADLRERLTDTQHRNGKNIVRAERAESALAAATAERGLESDPYAWSVEYTHSGGKVRQLSFHNSVGDYRQIDPEAISKALYLRALTKAKGAT